MIYAGIDIGSSTAKAALIKKNRLLGTHVIPTGYNPLNAGITVFEAVLEKMGVSKILCKIVAEFLKEEGEIIEKRKETFEYISEE